MPYRCSTECATTDDYYANAGQVKHYYHQTDPYQNCHVGGINPIRTGGRWGGGHLILHASLFKKNLPTYPKWKKISVSLKSVWYQNMIKRVRIFHEIWKFYILYSQILRESAPPPRSLWYQDMPLERVQLRVRFSVRLSTCLYLIAFWPLTMYRNPIVFLSKPENIYVLLLQFEAFLFVSIDSLLYTVCINLCLTYTIRFSRLK